MLPATSVSQSFIAEHAIQTDQLGLEPVPEDTRQRFLRIRLLGENKTLIPLQDIAEVRQLTMVEILPIPEISQSMLGVFSWRGEILWLADLNALVGDSPLWRQVPLLEEPVAIVMRSDQHSVGLVVEQIDDVELIEPESIHQQTDLDSSTLATFTAGYLPDHGGVVLDIALVVEHLVKGLLQSF